MSRASWPTPHLSSAFEASRQGFSLTLLNETWQAGVGDSEPAASRAMSEVLIRGIQPFGRWGAEAYGWERVVQPALLAMQPLPLTRVDDTTIMFAVPAAPEYDITAAETLAVHIDGSLVISEAAIVAQPPVPITVDPGVATLYGSLICESGYFETYTISPPPPRPPPDLGASLPLRHHPRRRHRRRLE